MLQYPNPLLKAKFRFFKLNDSTQKFAMRLMTRVRWSHPRLLKSQWQSRGFSIARTWYHKEIIPLVEKLEELNTSGRETSDGLVKFRAPEHNYSDMARLRVVPEFQSFYMVNPPHEEIMRNFNSLLRKYLTLPTAAREESITWMSVDDYRVIAGGSRLRPIQYKSLVSVLTRLSSIDPQLMPDEVWESLTPYFRSRDSSSVQVAIKELDQFGRAAAIGRRKESSCRVYLTKNTQEAQGQVLINGKSIDFYFKRLCDRNRIMYPLTVVNSVGNYNLFATVQGGGTTGQSGAIALGIARALIIHNPLLKPRLHKAGCLTRDRRVVERKKPGKPKARKSYTWVKR